jgi:hypothetical protein
MILSNAAGILHKLGLTGREQRPLPPALQPRKRQPESLICLAVDRDAARNVLSGTKTTKIAQ